jgi:hypothetical protein
MAKGPALLLVSALCAGCAGFDSAPATAEFARSERALADADEAGAAALAPAELALARQKLALARRWVAANDYKPARWLIEQACVDAELARAKAISARAVH